MSDLNLLNERKPAILVLADGSFFFGNSIGTEGTTVGEVIFNTTMTGYQEILTDPSYAEQIITFTYPHIGNVGVNANDLESYQIWAAGLIIRELSPIASNWRAEQSLDDYLKEEGVVAIDGVDTRRLTRLIRQHGALHGCIIAGGKMDTGQALQQARAYSGLKGKDLSTVVSTTKVEIWTEGTLALTSTRKSPPINQYRVLVYDYGLKHQIARLLIGSGCSVTIVPAQTSVEEALNLKPDGVVLSNGPGDPAACSYAIATIRKFLEKEIPLLGICLGFQLLILACGGKTKKMKFGHHGANHPVQDIRDGRVFITSQNHSFSANEADLPEILRITHRSLFDGTLQGIAHKTKPAIAFQGHPEASPGPQDMQGIFEDFIQLMKRQCQKESI
ncbi:glutamine-hydrolyzing carbamoyl-phosphate synthase small subunit [Coxiella endosymbiont of Amblyomma nuttalli]|uniref:glutamine-hydrolyzing carbamoyl-phosphate synthase small subunit n=1 Tax=Coxiella endosymbiont of Amblyomma nuttalli TaxID=2749996 RepID=UPI001BABB2EC|nr:glutamine-hydrolyzing carbamoyl-phosphate synthase small subunit [Coxiella endosymbiont of Amblyomma nuttalli]QTS83971.1 Carbamoyl-phosphate synthase small chain [Coxiella endosymbiont of Amblyomma nuttalli]